MHPIFRTKEGQHYFSFLVSERSRERNNIHFWVYSQFTSQQKAKIYIKKNTLLMSTTQYSLQFSLFSRRNLISKLATHCLSRAYVLLHIITFLRVTYFKFVYTEKFQIRQNGHNTADFLLTDMQSRLITMGTQIKAFPPGILFTPLQKY